MSPTPREPVLSIEPLGFPWKTLDPFLFCVHHLDAYPAGLDHMGPPREALAGRRIGMDFDNRDGWNMYHGDVVPGFPRHPHRGFETITIARQGLIDHSDSMGATARFGRGDVQWMTAGRGVVHSEMFPLVHTVGPNTTELFQIWLNLPAADKFREAYFTMFWADSIPVVRGRDRQGHAHEVTVIAGRLDGVASPPPPPPSSWAARPEAAVMILSIRLDPGATWTLPAGPAGVNRMVYMFAGDRVNIAGNPVAKGLAARVRPEVDAAIVAGTMPCELLVLQGRPIGEAVVQHGPFVMNTPAEIQQAFADYRRTGFGGWPWTSDGPVHPRSAGRFAIHADGRRETAG